MNALGRLDFECIELTLSMAEAAGARLLYWCKSACFTGTKVQTLTPQSVLAGSVRAADFDTQAISIILNSLSKAGCAPSPQVLPLYTCPHTTAYMCPHILYMLSHYLFFFLMLNLLTKPACSSTPQVLAHLQEAVRAMPTHDGCVRILLHICCICVSSYCYISAFVFFI
jgi:hypothetical protein